MKKITQNQPVPSHKNAAQRRFQKLTLSLTTFVVMVALIFASPNVHSGGCESTSGDCSVSIGQTTIV